MTIIIIHLPQNGNCTYNANLPHIALVKSIVRLSSGSETALKTAVGTTGPVSAGFDASLYSFQIYQSGV